MPVTKQAIKKVRQDRKKTIINNKVKKTYKKAVHDFVKNPTAGGLAMVYKLVDRAAKTNIIHRNKAARIKSRLAKKVAAKSKKDTPIKNAR